MVFKKRKLPRHLGSTIAIIVGILLTASSIAQIGAGSKQGELRKDLRGGLQGGPIAIIGALAYRSVKKRKLGEVKPTIPRKVIEGLGMGLIVLHFFFIKTIYLVNDPVPNVFIPLWALVAFSIISLKKEKPKTNSNSLTK